jgi:hypothetical protein
MADPNQNPFTKYLIVILVLIMTFFLLGYSTSVSTTTTVTTDVQPYTACGCGCCPDTTPVMMCLYHAKGDDMSKIIEQDKLASQDTASCALVGCSAGVKYQFCD